MLAFVALIVVFVMTLGVMDSRAQRRRLDQVERELRGLAEWTFTKGALRAIHVPCATSLRFALRAEDERTGRMREQGELVEMQAGDRRFDDKVFLECEDTRARDWLRRDEEARKLIASLVGSTRTLELRGGRLSLGAVDLLKVDGVLAEYARLLRKLADRVPSTEGVDPVTAPQRTRLRAVRAMSYVVLGVGLLAVCWAWTDYILNRFPQHASLLPLLLGAALVGAAPATLAYRYALRTVRDTSHAARLASELFVSIWIPIVGTITIAAHQLNLKLAAGNETAHETFIVDLHSERHRRSTSYHFILPALDGGRIPSAHYLSTRHINDGLSQGQRVRVRFRDGVLASSLLLGPPEALSDEPRLSK